jgi:hypothetical protein
MKYEFQFRVILCYEPFQRCMSRNLWKVVEKNFPLTQWHRLHKMFQVELNEVALPINHVHHRRWGGISSEPLLIWSEENSLVEWIYDDSDTTKHSTPPNQRSTCYEFTFKSHKNLQRDLSLLNAPLPLPNLNSDSAINLISSKYMNKRSASLGRRIKIIKHSKPRSLHH